MASYTMSLVLLTVMVLGFALAVRNAEFRFDPIFLWWAIIYMPVIQLGSKILLYCMHLDDELPLWHQTASAICDVITSILITPLLSYQHITFVLGILLGKPVQWVSPSRDPNDGLSWRLATRVFWAPTLIALVWIPLFWWLAPGFLIFSGAILIPWLLSIPLAVLNSNPKLGVWLKGHGVFACRRGEGELEQLGTLVLGTSDEWLLARVRRDSRGPRGSAGNGGRHDGRERHSD